MIGGSSVGREILEEVDDSVPVVVGEEVVDVSVPVVVDVVDVSVPVVVTPYVLLPLW